MPWWGKKLVGTSERTCGVAVQGLVQFKGFRGERPCKVKSLCGVSVWKGGRRRSNRKRGKCDGL